MVRRFALILACFCVFFAATDGTACSISASAIYFPAYSNISTQYATSDIRVMCASAIPYSIGIDYGLNSVSTQRNFRCQVGGGNACTAGDIIAYNLYRDPSYTALWGPLSSGFEHFGSGTGSEQSLTVYGMMPGGAAKPSGVYDDSMIITISY